MKSFGCVCLCVQLRRRRWKMLLLLRLRTLRGRSATLIVFTSGKNAAHTPHEFNFDVGHLFIWFVAGLAWHPARPPTQHCCIHWILCSASPLKPLATHSLGHNKDIKLISKLHLNVYEMPPVPSTLKRCAYTLTRTHLHDAVAYLALKPYHDHKAIQTIRAFYITQCTQTDGMAHVKSA